MAGERLILAADKLSRAGSAWDDFIKAMEEEASTATLNCVQSPPDLLQINQGRAQSAVAMLKVFKTCRQEAEKLRNKASQTK